MIFILTIQLLLLMYFIYVGNRGSLVSISFISTTSFFISSIIYCLFYSEIGADISFECVALIILSMIGMYIGEKIGKRISVGGSKKNCKIETNTITDNGYYYVSISKMLVVFIIMLIIFAIRFYDLYRYSLSLGNRAGVFGVIASVRLAYAMGEYTSSGILMTLVIYFTLICEIFAYAYLYYFLYNYIFYKKIYKRMLLPLLGYMIIAISFTGRTQYILVAVMIIWMLIYLNTKKGAITKASSRVLFIKIIKIALVSIILLFVYGALTRNLSEGSSIISSIVAYIGSSIYGFDQCKNIDMYGVSARQCFGYYTLQNVYAFLNQFGFDFPTPSFHHLRFFDYERGCSNIYTSLFFPYQDFGFLGVIVTRILIGFVAGCIEKKVMKGKVTDTKNLVWVIFMGILFYDGINAFIADRYVDNLMDPITIIKYTVFSFLVLKLFCNCHMVCEDNK